MNKILLYDRCEETEIFVAPEVVTLRHLRVFLFAFTVPNLGTARDV